MKSLDTVRIDAGQQTIVLASREQRLPEIVYWSTALEKGTDLTSLVALRRASIGHSMLDSVTELSVLPESGRAFPGHCGLAGRGISGRRWSGQFILDAPLAADASGTRLCITATDTSAGLRLNQNLSFDDDSGVLTLQSSVRNLDDEPYCLDWLACPVVPAFGNGTSILGFHGRWCREFQSQAIPWRRGSHVREHRLGRTSHEHFPGLLVPGHGSGSETSGDAWGFHLGWSGNHRLVAEELPDGRRQIQFGEFLEPGEICLSKGESYQTPELFAAFSADGFNGVSKRFHDHCRERILSIPNWMQQRPVIANTWEATYFDHDPGELKLLADSAAECGAELFVLDDGWFKGRTDDTAGLGDWSVDHDKYPNGLEPLVNHVVSLGMRFGLWVEPEMTNRDSDLYRSHPEWVLDLPGYQQVEGRQQLVLDVSRQDVRDYLFESIATLLNELDISYLKWDMNRTLNLAASSDGRAAGHRYVHGVYGLMQRIREAFPEIAIETCSSGGGRIDFGILQFTARAWLSDTLDPLERATMHRNASYFFPPEILGCHIGAAKIHTTVRTVTTRTACHVAAFRHFGMELDTRALSEDMRSDLATGVSMYREIRDWLPESMSFRLTSTGTDPQAELLVAPQQDRFIVLVVQTGMQHSASAAPLQLPGLSRSKNYRIRLRNADQLSDVANYISESPLADGNWYTTSGTTLMNSGIVLPNLLPAMTWVLEGEVESA